MDIASYGDHAIDLANTWDPSSDPPEQLPDVAAARAFLKGRVPHADRATEADLELLRRSRERIRAAMAAADDAQAVDHFNALLRDHPIHPLVSDHDDRDWHLHLADDERSPGELLVASGTFGLTAWLLDVGMDRRGQCAEHRGGCKDVFVDTSRNQSRRYCSTTCSNRANVAAHRERRRAEGD